MVNIYVYTRKLYYQLTNFQTELQTQLISQLLLCLHRKGGLLVSELFC